MRRATIGSKLLYTYVGTITHVTTQLVQKLLIKHDKMLFSIKKNIK